MGVMNEEVRNSIFLGDIRVCVGESLFRELKLYYGLNWGQIKKICGLVGVNPFMQLVEAPYIQIIKLDLLLSQSSYRLLGTVLRKKVISDRKYQIRIGSYRGIRLKQGLPVRGQRTKTNAQTVKRISSV